MGSFIAKQPNGLLCRFSSIVDCVTHWNMTEEDYIELCAERGRQEARDVLANYTQLFEQVVNKSHPVNLSVDEIIKLFQEMGYEPTEEDIAGWEAWGKDYQ